MCSFNWRLSVGDGDECLRRFGVDNIPEREVGVARDGGRHGEVLLVLIEVGRERESKGGSDGAAQDKVLVVRIQETPHP